MEKFDAISITQYQHYCALLLILILHIYTNIKSTNNNREFHFNNKEDRLKLRNASSQEILEDKKVT